MATYIFTVTLTVSPASGQTEILPAIEAEKVGLFKKRVEEAGNCFFGIGETQVAVVEQE